MGKPLEKLTIEGFKSIRELRDFELGQLNLLIGPNGAGKSNLVDFFRLLRAMADENLRGFVTRGGKAANFFFNGPQQTPRIHAHLVFGDNKYDFVLEPTVSNEMLIEETAIYDGHLGRSNQTVKGGSESVLKQWKDKKSGWADRKGYPAYVYDAVSSWMIYHFHDTGVTAPMRLDSSSRNFRELGPDAGNIAAFLLKLRNDHTARYQRIRETIQLVAPFFDDFVLEPQGDQELVRLEWRQKGSTYPFQPWNLSDGTIRFICLATALLQPNPPSTIIIDEPELGLHPHALETLSSLIHEVSLATQLVVSTQSAILVDHFEPHDVVVVQRDEGASTFRRLETADLEPWLDEYSLGALVRKNIVEAGPSHG